MNKRIRVARGGRRKAARRKGSKGDGLVKVTEEK